MLLSFREMYGLGEVGAVTKVLLLLVGKDILLDLCCFKNSSDFLSCRNGILPPLFIDFDLNTLSNSLLLPVLCVVTLILLSIDHAHSHTLSNVSGIVSPVLVSCASILLLLHIVLLH